VDRDLHPQVDWQTRVERTWARLDAMEPGELVRAIDALADERPDDDAAAMFERACARDTCGIEDEAEAWYRKALATGRLDAYRGARATLQLASTLRILGRLEESERMLCDELARRTAEGGEHPLHDEARATLALTWLAQGRSVEAACLALVALAPHLTRYNRSVAGNAAAILEKVARRLAPHGGAD
jgi:hypothetical protein